MTSFIIDLHNKCAYIYYKTEVAHYDRNSGSHISGMVAQAYRTGGSLEHRLFIMHSKYLPEKLLDRFQELTNDDADRILIRIFHDWYEEKRKKSLHDSALAELKKSKSLRIHWTVKRNKEIIHELFDIGFGIYEKDAKCDYQQGAENAFMYGYLLGVQSQKASS